MDPAAPIEALGAGDARCRVGPGRGARLSTSPFPRTALRTRRASHPGTGLSTRPATKQTVALPLGSAVPSLSRSGRRYSPAAPAPPTRHRSLAVPLRHVHASRVLGLLQALRHDPPPTADDAPAHHPKAGRVATGRFPRSPPPGRRGRVG